MAVTDVTGFAVEDFEGGLSAAQGENAGKCAQDVTAIAGTPVLGSRINLIAWHNSGRQLSIEIYNNGGEALTNFRVLQYVESGLATAASLAADTIDITEKFTVYPTATDPTTLADGSNVTLSHGRGDLPDVIRLEFTATTAAAISYIVRMA
jgi:hypothetical protein